MRDIQNIPPTSECYEGEVSDMSKRTSDLISVIRSEIKK